MGREKERQICEETQNKLEEGMDCLRQRINNMQITCQQKSRDTPIYYALWQVARNNEFIHFLVLDIYCVWHRPYNLREKVTSKSY